MKSAKGFTLIELLVVLAILGVLAAIAIPAFAGYRNQGYCGRVMNDTRHAFTAMEAYYAQNLVYGSLADAGFSSSDKVSVNVLSTFPLSISATDDSALCPKGNTYTLSGSSGMGLWS